MWDPADGFVEPSLYLTSTTKTFGVYGKKAAKRLVALVAPSLLDVLQVVQNLPYVDALFIKRFNELK